MNTPLVVLGILDGFGYSSQTEGNAIAHAKTPNLDQLWSNYPHFLLKAAEEEVGLAFGEVGNSEVGHITIGTGRVIPQSLSLINHAIENGSFFENKVFIQAITHARTNNANLHLLGIISTAGVHGHLYHYTSLIRLAAQNGLANVYLHLILDGRDSGPKDTPLFLNEINKTIAEVGIGTYASMVGRGLAMDRNNNWERTEQAYKLLLGQAKYSFETPALALDYYYKQGLDDESMPPCLFVKQNSAPVSIRSRDAIIITNFREDRARQITRSLALPAFNKFQRGPHPQDLKIATMTSYEKALPVDVAFPPPPIYNTMSDVASKHQIPQIHVAETEKYAHVTYFFNGGREAKAPYEEFFLVPSLKPEQFATNPQMSAREITAAILQSIKLGYKLIVFNYANADMVGHTGNFEAAVQAVQIIDEQIGQLWQQISAQNGYFFITADHGNTEQMINPKTKATYKEHTISPVPLIVAHQSLAQQQSPPQKVLSSGTISGLLSDIAPTILSLLKLPIPDEMSGTTLLGS